MERKKLLKKALAIMLCTIMITNNTLPILAESAESINFDETTIEEIDTTEMESVVETSSVSPEKETTEIESVVGENSVSPELEETEIETTYIEEPEFDKTETSESEIEKLENESIEETIESKIEITESETLETETSELEATETIESETTEPETTDSEIIASDSEIKIEEETTIDEILELDIATPSELNLEVMDIATPSELNLEVMDIATPSELDLGLVNIATLSEIDLVIELATASEIEERLIPNSFIQEDIVAPIVEDLSIGDGDNVMYRASSLPTKYDSRQQTNSSTGLSYIPPVRDQYPFGTCWAFSTLAMFEASLRVKGLVKNETESDLSEAALSYYTYGLEDITNNSTYMDSPGLEGHDFTKVKSGNFASRGGNQIMALFSASAYVGVVSENSDTSYSRLASYEGKENQYTLNKKYAFKSNNYVLENAYIINKANTDIIKEKIMENGAVGISYFASQEDVYMHKNGSDYYYFTNVNNRYANHGIAIVGWDDNIPADRFYMIDNGTTIKAKNPGGWLCRNSWGEHRLTNKGYFWMSYEEPGLATNVYAVDAMKADTYKYNYHYDTTGYSAFTAESASSTNPAAFANIFKVPNGQTHLLEAASVALNTSNTVLTVDVYTNDNEMTSPSDGTLKSTVTVERQTSGIFTIPLKDKVILNGGTYFSIIVRGYSKNASSLKIYYDTCGQSISFGEDADDPITFYNSADVGQSFLTTYSESSKTYNSWTDVNPMILPVKEYPNDKFGVNLRIKALANPVVAVKITFDSDGGVGTMNELTTVSNVSTTLPQNIFTKKGYKFDKWVDQKGNEYADKATINASSNLSLKAVWVPIKYTIKYNPNGGTVSVSSVKKTYGTNITLEIPTKQGYNFIGWYKESALTNKYDGTTDITTNDNVNVNLYAKWSPITYTITYDLKGVSATKPANINKTYLVNVTLAQPTNVQSGCKFIAWYKDSALRYQYKGTEDLSTTQGETITIYAKWKQQLIFENNGHGKAIAARDAVVGDFVLPSMSATGYIFGGWYSEAECRNLIGLAGSTYYVTGPKTFYAKWTPITYTINYDANGGSISTSTSVKTFGTNLTLLRPGKNNYEFKGWYKDPSLKTVYDGTTDLTTVNGSTITIYAKWEPKVYKVTLYTNGGTIISGMIKEYTYGIGAILPTNIKSSLQGYEFFGWYESSNFSGNKITNITNTNSGDKVYYAKYIRGYTITFDSGGGAGTMSSQKVFEGNDVVLEKTKFTRKGYTFNNWEASNGKTYSDGEKITGLTESITLVANWTMNPQTASSGTTYNGGGSSGGSGGSSGGGSGSGTGGGRISTNVLANDFGPSSQMAQNNQIAQTNQMPQATNNNNATKVSVFRAYTNVYNSSSATWVANDKNGKWKLNLKDETGRIIHPSNGFIQLNGYRTYEENHQTKEVFASDTYFFDENGDMVTGWLETSEGKVYYFNPENNSEIGKMAFGWTAIDGAWYFFALEGALYKNTTTPDGFRVDENGKLIS